MTSLDPATVRQAVAEFTPLRPQKFQDLLPEKNVITDVRARRFDCPALFVARKPARQSTAISNLDGDALNGRF